MIRCALAEAAAWCGGVLTGDAWCGVQIEGVCTDSRAAAPGRLFVPLRGPRFDGHAFAPDALARGASALLWRRGEPNPPAGAPRILVDDPLEALQRLAAAYRRSLGAKVAAVTGSNGKTSVKDMLASILSVSHRVAKTRGNLNNHIGVPLTLLELDADTEYAVVEVGMSAPGEIALLASLARPDAGVITGLGHAHLEQLGSLEAIADAKWELASHVAGEGTLVYNGDCEPLRRRAGGCGIPTRTFGAGPGCDLSLVSFEQREDGMRFTVSDGACPPLFLPMRGRHQAVNALAAALTARALGVPWEDIAAGLACTEPAHGRCEPVRVGRCTVLDDTYKSNPESVLAALETLCGIDSSRRLFVMGDMADLGADSAALHRSVGRALNPARLDAFYAFGPASLAAVEEARSRFGEGRAKHFADAEALKRALLSYAAEPCAMLMKASRVMQFEQFVHWLHGELEESHGE